MSKLITGSLCLTDLYKNSKEGHPAFSAGKDGRVWVNVVVWENDQPDERGNDFSVQLKKEKKEDKAVYVGNLKRFSSSGRMAASTVRQNSTEDDMPF